RCPIERGRDQVAVKDHVQVLVRGDPGEQLVCDWAPARLTGIPVRYAGGELLEADVGDALQQLLVARAVSRGHVNHPEPLQLDRIDSAGHHEIVAQRGSVPTLLGSPAANPVAPGA